PYSVVDAHARGYTAETLGCPIYPSNGIDEKWVKVVPYQFRNLTEFHLGGPIAEASFLVDFAHVKGHPDAAWGGVIKNLALGCMDGQTRGAMHDVVHYEPYFHKDKCRGEAHRVA